MLTGTANLIIDLGNSSTKCKVQYGKDPNTGKFYQRRFDISNVFAPISSDYEVSDEYNTETSTIINVDAKINGAQIISVMVSYRRKKNHSPQSSQVQQAESMS